MKRKSQTVMTVVRLTVEMLQNFQRRTGIPRIFSIFRENGEMIIDQTETDDWLEDTDGKREESEEAITRSRMWLWLRMGKFTCRVRLNEDSSERNCMVWESKRLSRWKLKSPVMKNSWDVVAATDKSIKNKKANVFWQKVQAAAVYVT